jgi:GcrA cell cycle regulator
MAWNDERVELLKKLWTEGLSASQIASRLGGVTRNAVIGKVHRLGLSGRATTARIKSLRPRARTNQVAAKRIAKPTARYPQIGNPAVRALYQPEAEPFQPAVDGHYVSARRKNSTPSGQPQRGRLLTQHTGLPPRVTGNGKPAGPVRRKPG